MSDGATYDATRARVETYFDKTATRTWEALTSDAPVSRVRRTVRQGRDRMREMMLSRLPEDLRDARILDAGCGAGQMTAALAARGATVVGADLSPQLIAIAMKRLPEHHRGQVTFVPGDMLSDTLGRFDAVIAMDSLIYYSVPDLRAALTVLAVRSEQVIFTVPPRTTLLMAMWWAGKLFPRSDRSPVMVPHSASHLGAGLDGTLATAGRVTSGFYISECLEYAP